MEGRCQTRTAGGNRLNFMATGRIAENKTKYLVTTGKFSNHSLAAEVELILKEGIKVVYEATATGLQKIGCVKE